MPDRAPLAMSGGRSVFSGRSWALSDNRGAFFGCGQSLAGHGPLKRSTQVVSAFLACCALTLVGCGSSQPRAVTPTGDTVAEVQPAGQNKDVLVQQLRHGRASSHHFVTLVGAEKPHVHDRSDLTVFILRGSVRMHFENREVDVGPGDVVDIPMGAFHWAENINSKPSLAYVVYSPAFDGKDRRFITPKANASIPTIVTPLH